MTLTETLGRLAYEGVSDINFCRYPVENARRAADRHRAFHDRIEQLAKRQLALPPPMCTPVREKVVLPPYDPGKAKFEAAHTLLKSIVGLRAIDVQRVIADHFKITVDDIICPKRLVRFVWPRQVCMYLVKQAMPHKSLPSIGRDFGYRDHTTVLHAFRKVAARVSADPSFAAEIGSLWAKIGGCEG